MRHAGQKLEAKGGYEGDACYDGDSALDWLRAEKYDLILLDLNLPGQDGMELLKTLRERDRETRVLILSARSRISDKVEGLDHSRIVWRTLR